MHQSIGLSGIATACCQVAKDKLSRMANFEIAGKSIFEAIPGNSKVSFLPETSGYHGSKTLWSSKDGNEEYWAAVRTFLGQFIEK